MFRLYACIVGDHDLALVALAALICAGTVVSAFKTFSLALADTERRRSWVLFSGASAAAGIWATHFVSMLAYNAPVPISYDPGLTALSLFVAAAATTTGFALSARDDRAMVMLGGSVLGTGIAAMHFMGMLAMELPGRVTWDGAGIVVSVAAGIALASASTVVFRGGNRYPIWTASALLVLAICTLHFTAMSAVTIIPDPTLLAGAASFDRLVLALGIAAMTAVGLGAGIAALTIEGLRGRIAAQVEKLQEEVDVRCRAEDALTSKQRGLFAHQATVADLMQNEGVRSGSLDQAMRQLTMALASGLGVDRAGTIILGKAGGDVLWREVFVAADGSFGTPELFGSPDHLELLRQTSPQEIVAVDDVSKPNPLEAHRAFSFSRLNVGSVMHAPIMAYGVLVGFMTCSTVSRTITWTAEQRVFALAIANLAALVVERHERLQIEGTAKARAERLARQQVLLNDLMRSESIRSGNLEAVMGVMTAGLCREMSVDRVSVRLFGWDGEEHVLTEVFVAREDRVIAVPRSGKRRYPALLAGLLDDGPIAVADCATHPLTAGFYKTDLEPRRIRAMLHAPVQDGGDIIGVVQCSTYDTPREWLPEDLLLASGVANLVALASERRLRLKIEQSLRDANLAAEDANRAKSLFLANMSHEIRTPMNGVLGMTELLCRSGLSERQNRLAGTIGDSARALLTIINDILDLSRIEGGKFELDPREFDLGACVEDAVELLAEQAHKKGLDLNVYIGEAALGTAVADDVRLRQVLVNLIGNAIKFTHSGEVSVDVAPVAGAEHLLRFSVRDSGIGIDPVVQAKLFQPFIQADTSITRRFGGTGLGLSISRHLVEMMGGTMGMQSEPEKGSCIWFDLPLKVTDSVSAERKPQVSLSGRRIIVIDDNATNREIIASYLAECGALIEIAVGGEEGHEQLEAAAAGCRPFEIAIVDFKMGGIDGLEFARRVRSSSTLAGIGLIMLSSMSWRGDAAEARESGIDMLMHKPIRRRDLIAGVSEYLSGSGANATVVSPSTAAEPARLGMHVLVAEDNPVNQVVAEEFLNNIGCTVVIAENGVQALAAIEREAFDLVLMDCQMPEMDGYSATREIRVREKERAMPALPIIAVTANAFESDRQLCLDAGMNGYLSKPYSEQQLIAALSPYCKSETARGATADVAVVAEAVSVEIEATVAARPANVETEARSKAKVKATARDKKPARGGLRAGKGKKSACAEPAIDLARNSAVHSDPRAKLRRTYLADAPQLMSALAKAAADCNAQALRLAAHGLKSSSANVGEDRIAVLAEQIEATASQGDGKGGDIAQAAGLVDRIARLIAELEAADAGDARQRPIKRA